MRFLVIGLMLVVLLAVGDAKRCRSSQDCADDECCISESFMSYKKGNCQKLAQKGDDCSEDDEEIGFKHKQYLLHCPCDIGLSCQPTQVIDLPSVGTIKYDEKCVENDGRTTETEP